MHFDDMALITTPAHSIGPCCGPTESALGFYMDQVPTLVDGTLRRQRFAVATAQAEFAATP
jgi:hypothetical protein